MDKGDGELCNERVLWKLLYLINNSEEIKNGTWLSNAYITNKKRLYHSYQSKHYISFYDFFVTQDYYSCVSVTVDLVLQY